ncbi:MAG: response regulator transcription factor [Chloroflexota bacterium]|nr:response regulator transcription factor [Chloroflexota bacterium]
MVLVIDDESEIRSMVVDVLASEGIDARAVGQFEALSTVEALKPDVVLLDVMMPGVDGYDILRCLRADREMGHPFVLMLTGNNTLDDVETGLNLGADDYVTKPFAIEELLARVRIGLSWSARH